MCAYITIHVYTDEARRVRESIAAACVPHDNFINSIVVLGLALSDDVPRSRILCEKQRKKERRRWKGEVGKACHRERQILRPAARGESSGNARVNRARFHDFRRGSDVEATSGRGNRMTGPAVRSEPDRDVYHKEYVRETRRKEEIREVV